MMITVTWDLQNLFSTTNQFFVEETVYCFFYSNSFLGGGNSNLFDFHPKPWGRFFPIWLTIICFRWVGSTNDQPAIFRPKVSPVVSFLSLVIPSPSTALVTCDRVMSYQVNFLGSALAIQKGGVGNLREPLHFVREPLKGNHRKPP